jgi:hypothetical protein
MKSARRHALQNNSLSQRLEDLPALFKVHLNKILIGVMVLALLIFLIRYRSTSAEQHDQSLRESLTSARTALAELGNLERTRPNAEQVAAARKQLLGEISNTVENVVQGTDESDASLRAEATLARGDLYWTLANAPVLPGAATQPSLQLPESREDMLTKSQAAYQQVVLSYSNQVSARVAAQFGLAAVAENHRDFDAAATQYKAVLDAKDVPDFYQTIAQRKLATIPEIKETLLIGPLNVETTQPTTLPTYIAAPNPPPTTAPATMP